MQPLGPGCQMGLLGPLRALQFFGGHNKPSRPSGEDSMAQENVVWGTFFAPDANLPIVLNDEVWWDKMALTRAVSRW